MPAFHLARGLAIDEIILRAHTQIAGLIVLGVRKAIAVEAAPSCRLCLSIAWQGLLSGSCLSSRVYFCAEPVLSREETIVFSLSGNPGFSPSMQIARKHI